MDREEIVRIEPIPNAWTDKVVEHAEQMSRQVEAAFVNGVREAEKWVPGKEKQLDDNRRLLLEFFFDYLFGTAIAVSCHYASCEEEFEEYVAQKLSEKFDRLRKIKEEKNGLRPQ